MTQRRDALIVATDEYEDAGLRRLRAPAQDAQALSRVLADPAIGAFTVHTVLNQAAHIIAEAVEGFFADRSPDDLLLLHLSCHGIKDESGDLHFAALNTKLHRLAATSVAADFVNRQMNRSRSRSIVLLLDCCYSGAFARGLQARGGPDLDVGGQFGGRGRAVITASNALEYAFEGDELAEPAEVRPSIFSSALVEALESGEADTDQDGYVGLDELYDFVYDKVREATPNQTPCKWVFGVQGDLYIARRRQPVTAPTPLPSALQQAVEHPLAGVRSGVVDELQRILSGTHAGLALAANQALQVLAQDDSRTVSASALAALRDGPSAGVPVPAPVAMPPGPPPAEQPRAGHTAQARMPVSPHGVTTGQRSSPPYWWGWVGRGILYAFTVLATIMLIGVIGVTATGGWANTSETLTGILCFGLPCLGLIVVTALDVRRLVMRRRTTRSRPPETEA